jgi:hypothetical protein
MQHYHEIRDEIRPELENTGSFLNAWLAVFFHEAPLNNDGTMYLYYREDYEDKLKQYLNFLGKLDPSLTLAKRYESAEKKIQNIKKKYCGYNRTVKTEFFLTILLPVVASALLLFYSIIVGNNNLPGNIFDINFWYFAVWAIATAGWLLWDGYETNNLELSTGCIGGPIIGAILGVIVYYVFYIIVSVPLFLGITLALSCYYIFTKLKNISGMYVPRLNEIDIQMNDEELDRLAFQYTFKKIKDIKISKSGKLNTIENDRKKFRIKAWSISIGVTILIAAILILLISFNPGINL